MYTEKATTSEPVHSTKEDESLVVYVWSTRLGLGHVSIQLDGKTPKYMPNDLGDYLSIWPSSTAAGGLTAVWPLRATSARSVEDDCNQEAIRPPADFSDLLEPIKNVPVQPDQIFAIRGLDREKIKEEFERIKKGLELGEVRYQLLPGVKLANYFTSPREVYNCVTLTERLLEIGGAENLTQSPWTTPSQFATQLRKQPRVAEIYYEAPENIDKQVDVDTSTDYTFSSQEPREEWRSNNDYDELDTAPVAQEYRSTVEEDVPSLRAVLKSSLAFFKQEDRSKSYLQKREESPQDYAFRMDCMGN